MSARATLSAPPGTRLSRRGFTLIEVVVALSAGVLVSMAVFMLSKNATAFFQYEARVSATQLGLNLAMTRLTSDIQRAAMLSSRNATADPNVCKTGVAWPQGLKDLAGVVILPGAGPTVEGNAQTPVVPAPDSIILGGNMESTEVFQVQQTQAVGSNILLTMRQPQTEPATLRALKAVNGTLATAQTDLPCKLKPVFTPNTFPPTGPQPPGCGGGGTAIVSGRFGHLYDATSDTHWFGVIDSFTVDAFGAVNVVLNAVAPIPQSPGVQKGFVVGLGGYPTTTFNVVSRVRYDIMDLTGTTSAQYKAIVTAGSVNQKTMAGDTNRTELVRRELDANDVPLDWATGTDTTELVAEYAVDLRFGITAVTGAITGFSYDPSVTAYNIGDPNVYAIAARPSTGPTATPQYVRAVTLRLSVRTRAPDRETDLPPGADGRRLRWLVLNAAARTPYARVRTNYATVALPNQGDFSTW